MFTSPLRSRILTFLAALPLCPRHVADGNIRRAKKNLGETDNLDFKAQWPANSSLARHMLALGNSGGGVLVCGVQEEEEGSLRPVGLAKVLDKAQVSKGVQRYLPSHFEYEVLDFSYQASEYPDLVGKTFQVLLVESRANRLPHLAGRAGKDLRDNAIYVRRVTESVEANQAELERLLNRRFDSGFSSARVLELQEHLEQLRTLYETMPRYLPASPLASVLAALGGLGTSEENPYYPSESLEEFLGKLIHRKKARIAHVLEVQGE